MPNISIDKSKIPLWSKGDGSVVLNLNGGDPNAPLPPGPNPIVDASFQVNGNQDFALGSATSVSLSGKAGAKFKLAPLWKDRAEAAPDLVTKYNLAGSFTDTNTLLALQVGANADLSAAASFRYSVLGAGTTLALGTDASFVRVQAFDRTVRLGNEIAEFFQNLVLPSGVTAPPGPGEVIALEYGGYLKFGVNASAGYELKGTRSFDISQLKLSEHYALSVVGKMSLNANLAGRFSVEVRPGFRAGWARVSVRRSRSRDVQFAADLNVSANLDTQHLPAAGREFLGALIGIRAKNWLNLIDSITDDAGKIASIDALKDNLDGLGDYFASKYVNKAVNQLLPSEASALLGRLQTVVNSYRGLDQSAIALFDRFFDPVLDKTGELEKRLTDLSALTSWDQLKGEVDPTLWNVVSQLTDGNPLGWILGFAPGSQEPSLDTFTRRVNGALQLIQSDAHDEIRKYIQLAKSQFGLDHFMSMLESVDSPDKLKTALSGEGKQFVQRLIGKAVDSLNGKDLKAAFDLVRKVVHAKDTFWTDFNRVLETAAKQSFSLAASAAYSASDDQTALIDLDIRLQDDAGQTVAAGQRFMQLCGTGDFQEVLAHYQPDVVRVRGGDLTHKLADSSVITINIAGWHLNYHYQETYRVIVSADQQIRPTPTGLLNVFTTIDLTSQKDRDRKTSRSEEQMHANFLLRFLGETHGILQDSRFNTRDRAYLVDVITGLSASYAVTFTDTNTTPAELTDMLLFARQLGLSTVGATQSGLNPFLENRGGNYGRIDAEYAVRFTERGLKRMFGTGASAFDIRSILRTIILGNYFGQGNIADVAWLYCSDDVKQLWTDNQVNFIDVDSILGDAIAAGLVRVTSPIPEIHPSSISNTPEMRTFAATLFQIEQQLVQGFAALRKTLLSATGIHLSEFQSRLKDFGDVLKSFDRSSLGDNTTFAVFDGLVRLSSPAGEARSSSLAITVSKGGQEHHITFLLEAAAEAARIAG